MLDEIASFYRRVKVDGECLDALYPGWAVVAFHSLSDIIHVLVLQETQTGRQALWFLNSRYDFCGSHVEFLENLETDDVLETVSYAFKRLHRTSLIGKPSDKGVSADLTEIPQFLALHLSLAWSARNIGNISVCTSSDLAKHFDELEASTEKPSLAAITRLLETRRAAGPLVVLSPQSDAPLRSQLSFIIDGLIIHRFYDPEDEAPFYLIWMRNKTKSAPSLYFPKSGLIVSDLDLPALIAAKILAWYLCNPDHVQMIEFVAKSETTAHGLGQVSEFTEHVLVAEDEAPLDAHINANLISPAWAFLNKAPTNLGEQTGSTTATSNTSVETKPRGRQFGRWFRKTS